MFETRRLRQLRLLVLLGLDEIPENRFFAQCLARLESMQTVHEDEALAIAPDQDRSRLTDLKHALRNFLYGLRLERRTALHRHIDVRDGQLFSPHVNKALLEHDRQRGL
jgi:hypothetical protein